MSLIEDVANDILEGDFLFIGCLKDHITKEYLVAVEKYLGYSCNNCKGAFGTA